MMLRICSGVGLSSVSVDASGGSTGRRIYFRHCQEGFHPAAAAAVVAPGDAPCLGPLVGR